MKSLIGRVSGDDLTYLGLAQLCLFDEISLTLGNLSITDIYIFVQEEDVEGTIEEADDLYDLFSEEDEEEEVEIEDANGNEIAKFTWEFHFHLDDYNLRALVDKRLKKLRLDSVITNFKLEQFVPDEEAALN